MKGNKDYVILKLVNIFRTVPYILLYFILLNEFFTLLVQHIEFSGILDLMTSGIL